MITGKTKITGIIGNPIEHSMSPPMHNNAYKQLNLDYKYVPFLVKKENLKYVIQSSKTLNIKGLNVTIPYKTDIIPYLDEIDPLAEKINAVNTLEFNGNKVKGYNTDATGALKSLKDYTSITNKNILILGSGGASKAIAYQLAEEKPEQLIIANRTENNAQKIIKNIKENTSVPIHYQTIKTAENTLENQDIIINTTPIGMYPNQYTKPVINTKNILSNHTVMDIVYNPIKTRLLKEAEKKGAIIIPGTNMLINQGLESFKIFTKKTTSYESFEKPLLKILEKENI
ncbi:MAG: shikimate dehydrogenase [Methanobacteriaceae archaeon]|nr:shikimate dehydrogenase [Methanobacteriaceae archaeon]